MHDHRLNIPILEDSACIFATEGTAKYHLNSYVRKVPWLGVSAVRYSTLLPTPYLVYLTVKEDRMAC
jgi:hypothetical protein